MRNIIKPKAAKQPFSRLTDGKRHPVMTYTVAERDRETTVERLAVVLADLQRNGLAKRSEILASSEVVEYGIDRWLSTISREAGVRNDWTEVAMADCPAGCKVYVSYALALLGVNHNNSYGCDITQAHIDAGVQHLPLWERDLLAQEPDIDGPGNVFEDWTTLAKTDLGHGEEWNTSEFEQRFLGERGMGHKRFVPEDSTEAVCHEFCPMSDDECASLIRTTV